MGLHNYIRPHTYLLTWPFSWCRKQPNWVWPSRLTKGKLMKTLWKADCFFPLSLPPLHPLLAQIQQAGKKVGGGGGGSGSSRARAHHSFVLQFGRDEDWAAKNAKTYTLCSIQMAWAEGSESNYEMWKGWIKGKSGKLPILAFWQELIKKLFVSSSKLLWL